MDTESTNSLEDAPLGQDPTLELHEDRRRNDLKLKGRFEHIFDKYTKDFSHTGDEIDLETGRIVINNGHLARMQNERDVGMNGASRFVKAIAEELEEEDVQIVGSEGDESDEDELSIEHNDTRLMPAYRRSMTRSSEETVSDGNAVRLHTPTSTTYTEALTEFQADVDDSEDERQDTEEWATPPPNNHRQITYDQTTSALTNGILSNVPAIQSSLAALAPHTLQAGQPFTVDPDAIHELGQNIAQQIAQFLTRAANRVSQQQPRDPWSVPPLPRDGYGYSQYRDSGHQRMLTPAPYPGSPGLQSPSGGQSLWALPGAHGVERPLKKRRLMPDEPAALDDEPHMSIEQHEASEPQRAAEDPVAFLQNANDAFRMLAHGIADYAAEPEVRATSVDTSYMPTNGDYQGGFANAGRPREGVRANRRFTKQEDELIRRMRDVNGLSWFEIVRQMPGRSTSSLQGRYNRMLRNKPTQTIQQSPIVKREIVEILDDDDGGTAAIGATNASGTYRVHPLPPEPVQASKRSAGNPLLRQALGNRFASRPDTALPGQYFDGFSQQMNGQSWPEGSSSLAAGPWMPADDLDTDYADDTNAGIQAPKPKKSRYHGKPESQSRYRRFDTTLGNGTFGMLRTAELAPYATNPMQQQELGPMTARSGTFGVLRMGKAAKEKKPKATRKAPKETTAMAFDPEQAQQPGIGETNQAESHLNSHMQSGDLREAGPSPYPVLGEMIFDDNDLLHDAIQGDLAAFAAQENMPPTYADEPNIDADDSEENLFVTPRETPSYLPPPRLLAESSPQLPTPPLDWSSKTSSSSGLPFSGMPGTIPAPPRADSPDFAPYNNIGMLSPKASTPKRPAISRVVSRSSSKAPAQRSNTIYRPYMSPTPQRTIPSSVTRPIQMRPIPFEDDSGDELG